jgi:hypothetical protein
VGLTAGLALLNYLADPYDRFGHNWLGVYISADREYKSSQVRRYPHDALLLGNSRMGVVPPDQLTGFCFFNGAFPAASDEEVYYFIRHFAQKEKLVILAVDPGSRDPAHLQGDIFGPASMPDILNNLFNLQTVEYSIRTISDHYRGIPNPMHANGWGDMDFWVKVADQDKPAYRDWQLAELKRNCAVFTTPPKEQMSFYVRIAECLRQRNIPCVVLVPPFHEQVARYVQSLPACAAAYRQWKRQLDAIFPYVVDLSYSSYGAAENFYKSDPVHFRSEAGVRMINSEVMPVALRVLQQRAKSQGAVPTAGDASPR